MKIPRRIFRRKTAAIFLIAAVCSLGASAAYGSGTFAYVPLGSLQFHFAPITWASIATSTPARSKSHAATTTNTAPLTRKTATAPLPGKVLGVSVSPTDAVTHSELDAALNSLRSQLFAITASGLSFSGPAASTPANFQSVALTQRIDQLANVTISNATMHGVSGLTAADIPTGITAANYLPLAGGTLTGTLSGTNLTLSGNLTVSGAQTLSGAITVPYLVATSTTAVSSFQQLLANGSTTLQNFTFANATGTNLTLSGNLTAAGDLILANSHGVRTSASTSLITITPGTSGCIACGDNGPVLLMTGDNNTSYGAAVVELALPDSGQITGGGNSSFSIYNASSFVTFFSVNGGTGKVTLTSSSLGSVGIGSSTPYAKLSVRGLGSGNGVTFQTTDSANAPKFTVFDSGKVGIGTTSPAQLLSVQGNALLSGNLFAANITATGTLSVLGLTDYASSTIGNGTQAGGLTIAGGATTTGNAYFVGNVGIGTANPTSALSNATAALADHVSGNIHSTGAASLVWNISAANTYTAAFQNSDGLYGDGVLIVGGADKNSTRRLLMIENNDGTQVLKVRADGVLEVGQSSLNGTQITPTSISLSGASTIAHSGGIGLVFSPFSQSSLVTFNQSGRILIGTAVDDGNNRLQVSGNIYASGNVGIGTTTPWRSLSVNGSSDLGTNALAGFFTATTTTATNTFAGKVGIGTTNAGTAQLYVLGPTPTDASSSALQIEQHLVALGSQNDLGAGILFKVNNGGPSWNSGSINGVVGDPIPGIAGFPGGLAFYTKDADGSATGPMFERMRINHAGNLGIGNTSPTYNLDVSGNGHFTGLVDAANFVATSSSVSSIFKGGLLSLASSTIGSGTQAGGLTISGGATTTGNAYFAGNVGIGTSAPSYPLTIGTNSSAASVAILSGAIFSGGFLVQNGNGVKASLGVDNNNNLSLTVDHGTPYSLVMRYDNGYVGIGTTTPWRTLSVTGSVGFDGLTGNFGAGSLCLSANKEVVYNAGSDACLSSLRSTKHDIAPLTLDALAAIIALQPVSFVYNGDASSTVRYGFIAEDTEAIDHSLATHDAQGKVSGIDDRGILSVVVKVLQALIATVSGFGDNFVSAHITATVADFNTANIENANVKKLCVGSACVTEQEFKQLLDKQGVTPTTASAPSPAAASTPAPEEATTTPTVDAPPLVPDYNDATTTVSAASSSVQ